MSIHRTCAVLTPFVFAVALLVAGCAEETETTRPDVQPPAADSSDPEPAPTPPMPADPPLDPVATAENPVLGVDVSHYSLAVDWPTLRDAGYDFFYVKATEGVDSPDPSFAAHWAKLAELGLARGAYHFYVTEDDPDEQARFFLDTVDLADGDLRPAVDVEILGHGTEPGLADRLHRFLELVEAETGVKPIIYTAPNFWEAHLDDSFGEYPLWIAEYGVDAPRVPAGWSDWTIWQYVDDGDVPGVEKDADLDRLRTGVSLGDLRIPPGSGMPAPEGG